VAPDEILDFARLYAENCSGCHGAEGREVRRFRSADPVYLALADDQVIRKMTANGARERRCPVLGAVPGDVNRQADRNHVAGIRARWSRRGILDAANPPSYSAKSAGNIFGGEVAYKTFCEGCHGPGGRGGKKGSSITDASFLVLVSDQDLRTAVIAGRPELGAPDWRGNVPGKPMSDQDITDVVAWLVSQRTPGPPQPNADSNSAHIRSPIMPNETMLSRAGYS